MVGVCPYLVRLVVILRVVFEDLGLLVVVECVHELVNPTAKVFPPFLAVNEPDNIQLAAAGPGFVVSLGPGDI